MTDLPTVARDRSKKFLELLRQDNLQCGVAESCTGGLLGASLTAVPGSSDVFAGGVIAYSNRLKRHFLGVPREVLREEGAVSAGAARGMAEGLIDRLAVDVGMSLTGVAGPGGGTERTPVGRVFGAVVVSATVRVEKWQFDGDRDRVRARSVEAVLNLATDLLQ